MKLAMKLMFVLVSVFSFMSGNAECCTEHAINSMHAVEKTYVLPEQVGFSEHGIFVLINHEWVQTHSLLSDAQGLYIQKMWPQENGCRKGFQPCRNCDKCISEQYDICPICHRPA